MTSPKHAPSIVNKQGLIIYCLEKCAMPVFVNQVVLKSATYGTQWTRALVVAGSSHLDCCEEAQMDARTLRNMFSDMRETTARSLRVGAEVLLRGNGVPKTIRVRYMPRDVAALQMILHGTYVTHLAFYELKGAPSDNSPAIQWVIDHLMRPFEGSTVNLTVFKLDPNK